MAGSYFQTRYVLAVILAGLVLLVGNWIMGLHQDVGDFYPVSNSEEQALKRGVGLYGEAHRVPGLPGDVEVLIEKVYSVPSKNIFWERIEERDSIGVLVRHDGSVIDSIDVQGGDGPHRCCVQVLADSGSRPRYVRLKTDTTWLSVEITWPTQSGGEANGMKNG